MITMMESLETRFFEIFAFLQMQPYRSGVVLFWYRVVFEVFPPQTLNLEAIILRALLSSSSDMLMNRQPPRRSFEYSLPKSLPNKMRP